MINERYVVYRLRTTRRPLYTYQIIRISRKVFSPYRTGRSSERMTGFPDRLHRASSVVPGSVHQSDHQVIDVHTCFMDIFQYNRASTPPPRVSFGCSTSTIFFFKGYSRNSRAVNISLFFFIFFFLMFEKSLTIDNGFHDSFVYFHDKSGVVVFKTFCF